MEPDEQEEENKKKAGLEKGGYACRKFEALITTKNLEYDEESISTNSNAEFNGVFKGTICFKNNF